jgi:23S rRNA A1618 N6-methylase RlmF
MNDVRLNHQIVVCEIGRISVVRKYAADLCGSKKDKFWFFLFEQM